MIFSSIVKLLVIRLIAAVCTAAAAENLLPSGGTGVRRAARKLIALSVAPILIEPFERLIACLK